MNRSRFYNTVTVNGTVELDLIDNSLSAFQMKRTPGYHRVSEEEIARPDLISYRLYGTHVYWWIICLVNAMSNPLMDLEVGDVLTIPNLLDIHDFYRRYKVR
jgi:hypothetical protein